MAMITTNGEQFDFQPVFAAVDAWASSEMVMLDRESPPAPRGGLILGGLLYGKAYIEVFDRYCLPSLLSESNMAVLRGKCRLVLYTDGPSYKDVRSFKTDLEARGIEVQIGLVPDAVMAHSASHYINRYWILGTAQNIEIQMARKYGMGFHGFHPDVVYNPEYFPNLLRLAQTHEGIAQAGLCADIATAAPEIEKWREPGGLINIPARDLGDLGWRHMHKQHRALMMNRRDFEHLPRTAWLCWQGKEKLVVYSAHLNEAYMSPALCAKAETRIPATIDAEMPSFMPEFYVPRAEDGLTYLEISQADKPDFYIENNIERFAFDCWNILKFNDKYLPYLERRCEIPIHPQETYIEDIDIGWKMATLFRHLIELKPKAAIRFAEMIGRQG